MKRYRNAKQLGGNRIAGVLALGGIWSCLLTAPPAAAFTFEGESVSGSFDSTVSFGFRRRMQSTDCSIIGNDNGGCVPTGGTLGQLNSGNPLNSNPDFNALQGDDGNLNYKKGDITSLALKGTHELYLKLPAGWSGLVRGTWLRDFKAGDTRRTPLSDDAKGLAVTNWTWLDAYISRNFNIGDAPVKVKVGNQVLSWGEDIFIYGGVNVVNPIYLDKFRTPGTQLKEVFRPVPMASFNAGVTEDISLEGFYQWQWVGFRFDAVGSYFSTVDVIGRGAKPAFVPSSLFGAPAGTVGDPGGSHGLSQEQLADPSVNPLGVGTVVPRGDPRLPKKSGQYGLALRYKQESIGNEYGLYYLRYNDRIPSISFNNDGNTQNPLGLSYFEDYGEKRNLYGASMNMKLGFVAVGLELSYRPKDSVGIDPTVPVPGQPYSVLTGPGVVRGFVDERKWQGHATAFYLIPPSSPVGTFMRGVGASEGFILAEAAAAYYPKLDLSGRVPYLLPNYEMPTKTSWGYVVSMGLTYPNPWGNLWNVTPQLDFAHDVRGTSPNTLPFVQGRKAMTLSLNFDKYNSKYKANIGYSSFWDGGSNNLLRDRDFLFGSVSISF